MAESDELSDWNREADRNWGRGSREGNANREPVDTKLTGHPPIEVIRRRRAYEAMLGLPPGALDNSPTLPIVDKLMWIMAEEASEPNYLAINAEFS